MKKRAGILILLLIMLACCTVLAESTWKCPSCGASGNTGKYCPSCGSAKPDNSWTCPSCGKKQTGNFCVNDGTQRSISLRNVKAGEIITFGHYPQTASGKDKTPIEWQVLEVRGNKALVISKYGLDARPYNADYTSVSWTTCSLRRWLNKSFLNKAFTKKEQASILTTTVDNSRKQLYSGWSTCRDYVDSKDKLFLLSYAEAKKYFGAQYYKKSGAADNIKSRIAPTAYAVSHDANRNGNYKTSSGKTAGWWWLRSPGLRLLDAARVRADGAVTHDYVNNAYGLVRPAMWIRLN